MLTGEALTQSSLLEADGENGDNMVTMTTTVEPMNLHHAMLRSPGKCWHMYGRANTIYREADKTTNICSKHSFIEAHNVLLMSKVLIQQRDFLRR